MGMAHAVYRADFKVPVFDWAASKAGRAPGAQEVQPRHYVGCTTHLARRAKEQAQNEQGDWFCCLFVCLFVCFSF